MQGNPELVKKLDELLADELTAVMQYMVHSEMCDDWGYERLHKLVERRAIEEMKHAESLIGRIISLGGTPTVSKLNAIHIGPDVPQQFQFDRSAELEAVKLYNEAIHLADKVADAVTRQLLESIVKDEDAHMDWLEEQLDQIQQMGVAVYLSTHIRE
ncbi:MAG: bacterioferritin [Thermogutta sp.]|nr:bacterioferritin [Thermogutta sp.]